MNLSRIPSPRKIYPLVCLTMALSLMVFPYGVALNFGAASGETALQTAAYFSLTPFGHADFLPLLAGLLTLAVTVLFLLPDRFHLKRVTCICLAASIVCSPLSWLIFQSYTGAGLAIVIFQALALVLILLTRDSQPAP